MSGRPLESGSYGRPLHHLHKGISCLGGVGKLALGQRDTDLAGVSRAHLVPQHVSSSGEALPLAPRGA
jgi:hypothetical protein